MPFLRTDAPASVPNRETVEALLGKRNYFNSRTKKVKTLSELSLAERLTTGLVRAGKTTKRIEGDPHGTLMYFAGNVSHHMNEDMDEIMLPLFEQLKNLSIRETDKAEELSRFLAAVPKTDSKQLAKQFSDNENYELIRDDRYEVDLRFQFGTHTVRLLQINDLNKDDKMSYHKTQRAITAEERVRSVFDEPPMALDIQQFLMASMAEDKLRKIPDKEKAIERFLSPLRAAAQEHFWLQMTKPERDELRQQAMPPGDDVDVDLGVLQQLQLKWPRKWDMGRFDCDYFRQYLRDQKAANEAWTLVEEDIFIVTDSTHNVVFANIENLATMLYGPNILDVAFRAIDMWSFFTPLPAPESRRHVVDEYIRKLHPELDMSQATVESLVNAKMAVAHYGSWSVVGDPHGKRIYLTPDTKFNRCQWLDGNEEIFPKFASSVLGLASNLIRYMFQPLDPGHYQECREVFDNLPKNKRISTCDENFLSLFALGINAYTQRHRDTNDIAGGLAGLFTLGRYTGGNLCIPQLGIKTKYVPGTCALIRGDVLEHVVADYTGPRFFIVGTNHESCKRHAFRKLGRLPPLPTALQGSQSQNNESNSDYDDNSDDPDRTCINHGHEGEDPDLVVTNKWLHGPGALDWLTNSSESNHNDDVEEQDPYI